MFKVWMVVLVHVPGCGAGSVAGSGQFMICGASFGVGVGNKLYASSILMVPVSVPVSIDF